MNIEDSIWFRANVMITDQDGHITAACLPTHAPIYLWAWNNIEKLVDELPFEHPLALEFQAERRAFLERLAEYNAERDREVQSTKYGGTNGELTTAVACAIGKLIRAHSLEQECPAYILGWLAAHEIEDARRNL